MSLRDRWKIFLLYKQMTTEWSEEYETRAKASVQVVELLLRLRTQSLYVAGNMNEGRPFHSSLYSTTFYISASDGCIDVGACLAPNVWL